VTSRRGLQIAIALFGLVPVLGGLAGVVLGGGMASPTAVALGLDSHVRYLSGLLLGIGLVFYSLIPTIEREGRMFRALTLIVVIGGLARLAGLRLGLPPLPMRLALVMELVVTPLLCLWQSRLSAGSPT
jgi:hypothetical protein